MSTKKQLQKKELTLVDKPTQKEDTRCNMEVEIFLSQQRNYDNRDVGIILYPVPHNLQWVLVQMAASIAAQVKTMPIGTNFPVGGPGAEITKHARAIHPEAACIDDVFLALEAQVAFLYAFVVRECEVGTNIFWRGPWCYPGNRELIVNALADFQEYKTALIKHMGNIWTKKGECGENIHTHEPFVFMQFNDAHARQDWSDHNERFLALEVHPFG